MRRIHPSATVEPGAGIGGDVEIGPNCYVGPHVVLGDGCRLHNNVTITGRTTVGKGNVFFPTCVIGADPQDLKFQGEPTELIIGDDNVFRELVTVHTGTGAGGGLTRVGSHNRFLVGVHIAHDVIIRDHCVVANGVQFGGHVLVGDYATFGGMSGVHHFVRVGDYAFLAAMTRANMDVPPFMIVHGYEGRVRGVNVNGMTRWGFPPERIQPIRQAFKDLYSNRSRFTGSLAQRLDRMASNGELTEDTRYLVEFVRQTVAEGYQGRYLESQRGQATRQHAEFYRNGQSQESGS
ncbi:MAG: acyl-ACP--UDP-N-acetylglucosamine O-acyltransferase [Phycisphaerae bacterium]|nr:acyl-ACP--UDP-N-acetylglucosamine O-acyltransferase [Phycisphaerae bacterium]